MVPGKPRIGKLEELAPELEVGIRPGAPDDLEALGEDAKVLGRVSGIGRLVEVQSFPTVKPAPDRALDAPLRHMVQHGEILGEAQRMPEGDDVGGLPDTNVLRMRGGP